MTRNVVITKRSTIASHRSTIVRPLLKWAGGKRQLLPQLRRFYPPSFRRYIEPFFGSGAVFFDLHARGLLEGREAILIDSNADLVGCYEMVRDQAGAVASALDALAAGHARAGTAHYYAVRDEHFNPQRDARRMRDGRIRYTPELAAMLIYLNRTGFNGLFRLNSRGGFNVPAGRYERPRICDRPRLAHVEAALQTPGVGLMLGSFDSVRELAGEGDFLYVDPPYAPMSRTASFTAYTSAGFGAAEQDRLRRIIVTLARRGCHVVLSNSATEEVGRLYGGPDARAAGLRLIRVPARRAINSDPEGRGAIHEYLVTNVVKADD